MSVPKIKELIEFAKSQGLTELEVDGVKFKLSLPVEPTKPDDIKIPHPLTDMYGHLDAWTDITFTDTEIE